MNKDNIFQMSADLREKIGLLCDIVDETIFEQIITIVSAISLVAGLYLLWTIIRDVRLVLKINKLERQMKQIDEISKNLEKIGKEIGNDR